MHGSCLGTVRLPIIEAPGGELIGEPRFQARLMRRNWDGSRILKWRKNRGTTGRQPHRMPQVHSATLNEDKQKYRALQKSDYIRPKAWWDYIICYVSAFNVFDGLKQAHHTWNTGAAQDKSQFDVVRELTCPTIDLFQRQPRVLSFSSLVFAIAISCWLVVVIWKNPKQHWWRL